MYRGTRKKIILGDISTDWVGSSKGVRQGCTTLSPLLFSIYTEELAARIKTSGLGLRVGERGRGNMLGCLLYADDIVIIAENESMLQDILNIVGE